MATKSSGINVSKEQLSRIDYFAKQDHRSRNGYITKAVLEKLSNDEYAEKLKTTLPAED